MPSPVRVRRCESLIMRRVPLFEAAERLSGRAVNFHRPATLQLKLKSNLRHVYEEARIGIRVIIAGGLLIRDRSKLMSSIKSQ